MYVKIHGQLNSIKQTELTSDSTLSLLHIETERGTEEVLNALLNRITTITCANLFPEISIYLATSFVGTKTSLSR